MSGGGCPFKAEIDCAGVGTFGVISGSNQGSIMAPSLPGGVVSSASENSDQFIRNSSRTRSRARDPFRKTVIPIYVPSGDARLRVPFVRQAVGRLIGPKIVSLVPRNRKLPSSSSPVPTSEQGLSPDHAAIWMSGSRTSLGGRSATARSS